MRRVDFTSLQQRETRLAKSSSAIDDGLTQLDQRVDALKGAWTGEAARAYDTARHETSGRARWPR